MREVCVGDRLDLGQRNFQVEGVDVVDDGVSETAVGGRDPLTKVEGVRIDESTSGLDPPNVDVNPSFLPSVGQGVLLDKEILDVGIGERHVREGATQSRSRSRAKSTRLVDAFKSGGFSRSTRVGSKASSVEGNKGARERSVGRSIVEVVAKIGILTGELSESGAQLGDLVGEFVIIIIIVIITTVVVVVVGVGVDESSDFILKTLIFILKTLELLFDVAELISAVGDTLIGVSELLGEISAGLFSVIQQSGDVTADDVLEDVGFEDPTDILDVKVEKVDFSEDADTVLGSATVGRARLELVLAIFVGTGNVS